MKGKAGGELFHCLCSPLVPLLFLQILVSVFFQIYSYLGFQPRWEREKELTSFRSSLKITQLALLRNKKFLRVLAPHGVDVRLNLVSLFNPGSSVGRSWMVFKVFAILGPSDAKS